MQQVAKLEKQKSKHMLNSIQAKMQNQIEFKNEFKVFFEFFFKFFPEIFPGIFPEVFSGTFFQEIFRLNNFFYWHELDSVTSLSSFRKSSIANNLINSINTY